MIPDVYEVFELLEFHYILKAFDTIEEAIHDFNKVGSSLPRKPAGGMAARSGAADDGVMVRTATRPAVAEQNAGVKTKAAQSLDDHIRAIVTENPDAGTFKIKQLLATQRFGNFRLGWFDVRRRLKEMGLDSKQKRIDFYKLRV